MTELDARHRQVLMAVIAEYVDTAEPVGSRSVARRHMRGLSAATVRNVMADLEDMGYLAQPHTSAGRLPTDKAYRFYVDALGRVPWTASPAVASSAAASSWPGAEQVMVEAPARLSLGSQLTGVLLAPPLEHTALDRLDLIRIGEGRALVVLVTDTGWVTTRALPVEPRYGAEELREVGRVLTRRYRGQTFQAILDDLTAPADPLDPLWTRSRGLLDPLVALLRDRTLYISGAINMLDQPDFGDAGVLRRLLKAFEEKARLIDLLTRMAQERGTQVLIGGENPVEEMRECSLITSVYTYRDQVLGVLGVVGPRRMAYSEVIALVDETARQVSSSLGRAGQEQLYLPS
ncbi:MAG: heat-inducible transcriptional repressor HrcA [Candidatus Rokubacteria bacterium]|nr:heat-inducible transcriptional repressor HrcA [Candidatus Rokubacteria bacterium]